MKEMKFIFVIIVFTLMFQGCSWMHILQIKNTTDTNWQIEYKILDERGIFKNQIYIQNEKKKKGQFIEYDSEIMKFQVKPKQTIRVGMARNSHFKVYKQYSKFDEEVPWKTFINVIEIKVSNQSKSYNIKVNELEKVLSKNSRGIARIEIQKVIDTKNNITP